MRCCVQCRDAQSKVWMHDLCITCICISLQLSASHIVSQCISLHHSAPHCNTVHLSTTQYILCIPFLCIPLLCTRQGQAALAAQAGCSAGELGSMRWRLFFAHWVILMEVEGLFLQISRSKKNWAEHKTIQISNWLGIIATGVDALERRNSWYSSEVQIEFTIYRHDSHQGKRQFL